MKPRTKSGNRSRSAMFAGRLGAGLCLLVLVCVGLPVLAAQEQGSQEDSAAAPADSTTEPAQDLLAAAIAAAAAADSAGATRRVAEPLFQGLEITTRAGTANDVRKNNLNGKVETRLSMLRSSTYTNTFEIGRDEYRQQDKVVDSRSDRMTYTSGKLLPFNLTANGNYDWSEDNTINNAGFSNLNKRTTKTGSIIADREKIQLSEIFSSRLRSSAGLNEQHLVNRGVVNDVSEEYLDGSAQLAAVLAEDVKVVTRVYGRTASGDRNLGQFNAPSSAGTDSLNAQLSYDRSFGKGRVKVSRGNFEKRYLDYRKDSNGQIDTLNVENEFDKIVDEVETSNIFAIEYHHEVDIGPFGLAANLSRDTDELGYSASLVGTKEKLRDAVDLSLTFGASRDSVAIKYSYQYRWDDQRYKGASAYRGKQYNKMRQIDAFYSRLLFTDTHLNCKLRFDLAQDTAENGFNANDKDRLNSDLALTLDRRWDNGFSTDLLFSYKQAEEVALHPTRSSNNNLKDSYEISPSYKWTINEWLSMTQAFRVYIQYVDYVYSELEGVNKEDSYNKRGNLNTLVKIQASERLEFGIRHDFNKRYNATKSATDASGATYYFTDNRQSISKIDLAVDFKIMDGVTLEAATFRTRDFKERFGGNTTETEVFKGEVWVGCKVDRQWGRGARHLSATVKKLHAYGPSVTEASADYWEADAWLELKF